MACTVVHSTHNKYKNGQKGEKVGKVSTGGHNASSNMGLFGWTERYRKFRFTENVVFLMFTAVFLVVDGS